MGVIHNQSACNDSRIPASLKPFLTILGLSVMYLCNETIHAAPRGLRTLSLKSTVLFSAWPSVESTTL